MAPTIAPVQTSPDLPASTSVVVIGGGIVGLTAALVLRERGIPVTVIEKGRVAAEQSSRNLGWIRKMGRVPHNVAMAQASERLWAGLAERVGTDVGYRQAGIMYICRTEAEMAVHEAWLRSVSDQGLDSRLLSNAEIAGLVPGGRERWAGGIVTPSDGRGEPTLAPSAIANAAMKRGAVIVENCAVRTLSRSAGKVSGVVTERGEVRCDQVLLAGGLWSRRFLGNHGVFLPTLPLISSVIRTAPMEGPTEIAVGGPDFSFRKRADGGYTLSQRGGVGAPLTLDHMLIGLRYLASLRAQRHMLRISLGREFLDDLALPRRWKATGKSPFEKIRTMDPPADEALNAEAVRNLKAAWPVFEKAVLVDAWAGTMDMTPDSLPVVDNAAAIPGLTIATGFSGHGFGTAPAAGQLAADLIDGSAPIVDPAPYRLDRF